MLTIRIVAVGAFLLSLLLISGGSTMAQAATGAEAGKPLQLLRVADGPGKAKTKPHARIAHHRGKVHFAAAKAQEHHSQEHRSNAGHSSHADEAAETAKAAPAADTAPANIWPDAPTGPAPANVAADLTMQAPPAAAVPAPSELVVGGRTVDVVASDQANEIDLAASAPQTAAADQPRDSAATKPAAATAFVAMAHDHDEAGVVGSASWIAQVLAALGGAVAAGSVAWFLIGSAPQRTYS